MAVGRLPVSWMGWTGNSNAMPPASRMPSRTRLASSRCDRLQGARSDPDWAMPMIGLPDCSSSRVRPQFRYRSMYSAVMSGSSGLSNQSCERSRTGGPVAVSCAIVVSSGSLQVPSG